MAKELPEPSPIDNLISDIQGQIIELKHLIEHKDNEITQLKKQLVRTQAQLDWIGSHEGNITISPDC